MNDKPSQASLTRFCLESGADTRERNLFLRQRFSLARRHIDRTFALLLAYSANGKSGFTDTFRRAVGAPAEETGGENLIFTPSNPRQTAVLQRFDIFAGAEKMKKRE